MSDGPDLLSDLNVSRETIERLEALVNLLTKWTKSINLIAPNSVPDIWKRHILDSAQVYQIAPKSWTQWVDLGSGGGLPALVIAILDESQHPMTLVESDKRKCLFLSTVRRELSLNISVENTRIEKADIDRADVLSARALASLSDLLVYSERLLKPDGIALFSKGERFQQELDEASKDWHFDMKAHPSKTNTDARILEISGIQRREP